VNDEIDMAWRLKNSPAGMRIIPVLYQPCEVRIDLGDLQIISFLPPQSYESAFKALLMTLGLPADGEISRTTNESDAPDRLASKQGKSKRNAPTVPKTTESTFIKDPAKLKNVHIPSRAVSPPQTAPPVPSSLRGSVLPFDGNEGKTAPVRSPGFFKGKILLLISLALLIIVAGVGFSLVWVHQKGVGIATTPTTIATAQITTTATTSQVPTGTITSSQIPTGVLVLDDPMRDASRGYQWDQVNYGGGGRCGGFTNNVYHVSALVPGEVLSCNPEAKVPLLKNLTFQVQMSIVSGDEGGITFRGNSGSLQFYYFAVASDGSYHLDIVNGNLNFPQILLQGMNVAIKKGLNQPNVLTVVASGTSISVYVNNFFIGQVHDSTYSQGQIGIAAGDTGDPTEAVFSNAKVWT
jgi:hypothetical protein